VFIEVTRILPTGKQVKYLLNTDQVVGIQDEHDGNLMVDTALDRGHLQVCDSYQVLKAALTDKES
jgi:hypothetical protein